jgi:lipopolysaccharide transport system permease protein
VLRLGIPNFPVFVFSGLVAWFWFSSGVGNGTSAILAQRHLVLQPGFPVAVLPVVAVAVPFVDVLMSLPILVGMVAFAGTLDWTVLFLPVLVILQLVLMCGVAWLTAATTVYLRDVRNIVGVLVTLLFYLTPVFYDRLRSVPEQYHWVLHLNPMTAIIEGWRAVLLEGRLPSAEVMLTLTVASASTAALGYAVFRRLSPGLVDEL